ncbi:MAG: NADH-quinone oxidoreductase subunit N [bacterium]
MGEAVVPILGIQGIMPELILGIVAAVILLLDLIAGDNEGRGALTLSVAGLLLAFLATFGADGQLVFSAMLINDGFSAILDRVFLLAALLVALMSRPYLARYGLAKAEYFILLLLATVGMMVMGAATDFITIFLGLEMLSLCLYVLAGYFKRDSLSGEAAFKYFILGAFATGFLVYGMAFVYGALGTTNLATIAQTIQDADPAAIPVPTLAFGLGLILVGLGFKVSLAPFHMWAPDVYMGAPTPVTALIATGSKAAGFAVLVRIFTMALPGSFEFWGVAIWWLALLTMVIGNFFALMQAEIKRMLAYSSIAHGGYLAMAFLSQSSVGVKGLLFYLFAYTLMTAGAFGVVALAGRKERFLISEYAGLSRENPFVAALMSLFLLSLAGMPGTAGFFGKFYLFAGAIRAGYLGLAIMAILTSVISFFYYLRVIVYMYMRDAEEPREAEEITGTGRFALVLAAVGVIVFGCFPNILWSTIEGIW